MTGEYSETASSGQGLQRTSLGVGVGYKVAEKVDFRTQGDVRREDAARKRLQFFNQSDLEVQVGPDFRLLGRSRIGLTRDRRLDQTEEKFHEQTIGLAYRPIAHDQLDLLARYARLLNQEKLLTTNPSRTLRNIVSLEGAYELTPRVELVEKLAARIQESRESNSGKLTTHTYLNINRLNLRVLRPFDLGTEFRVLFQEEADDRKAGWLSEAVWNASDKLRFGVGYNFTDFSDNEYTDNDYTVHGWFMRVQGKY